MFFLYLILLVLGFWLLVKGADLFVDGSTGIAGLLNVSGLVIGLTIVAFGTSAPELAVSTTASMNGSNEIALSNVTGSNIFNLLCVLGICAVIKNVPVEKIVLKRDFPFSIFTTFLMLLILGCQLPGSGKVKYLGMEDKIGSINRIFGIISIIVFIIYIVFLIYASRKKMDEDAKVKKISLGKSILLVIFGITMIIGGGQAVVNSAKFIAKAAGMTETLIGLTVVAVGTSLPELVTSIVAAKKGESGLAVGNAIGSNIFNLLLILGLSATINPIDVNLASLIDISILLAISIITYVFVLTGKKITRLEGITMILIYIADLVFAIIR